MQMLLGARMESQILGVTILAIGKYLKISTMSLTKASHNGEVRPVL